jgi:leucyl/phenylalanyl-tRNA--protein transferase
MRGSKPAVIDQSSREPLVSLEIHTAGPPQQLPPCPYAFPDPRTADRDGFVAFGGDFEPSTIVTAYQLGMFPWPHPAEERLWFSPDPRAIIPLEGLHISHRLARRIRTGSFRVTLDAGFEQVIRACAQREEGTWITPAIIDGYVRLHVAGGAHSFEVWDAAGELVGGLYGVGVGTLFGAESMFHRATDASKVAMVAMMEHARRIGLTLIDVQVLTEHTARMGAIEISRSEYLARLQKAVRGVEDVWRSQA